MPNMAQAVSRHNAKVLKDDLPPPLPPGFNCRNAPGTFPVQALCLTHCVVYRAQITDHDIKWDFIGQAPSFNRITKK